MPISIGGQTFTDQQIKDFYRGGGNERQFLQQAGITDPWQSRDLMMQARQIGGAPTMQQNFQNYQKDNPGGAYANDYQGWLNDIKNGAPGVYGAMQAGTYTGANFAPTDWDADGIYGGKQFGYGQSGQGRLGIGDGWGGANIGDDQSGLTTNSRTREWSSSNAGQMNPYLDQMAGSITNQMNANWQRNLEPSVRSGAMAAGGFGGSRQGVVEANGLRDLNQTLGNSLANLYGTGWQNAQQNALQSRSIDNQYDLGLRANNLGYANLDSNNAQFGANLNLNTLNAMNNWAQNGVNAANQMYQMPTYYQNMFNQNQNQIAGQGGTTTGTVNMPGNRWLGALGGWQLGGSR